MHNPPLVLIADDESDFREIVAEKLKSVGFWVTEAKDGDETVDKATNLKPDLILLDINMPRENGTEALIDLKANPETRNMKILFLSNLKNPWPLIMKDRPEFAKELGAEDFIDKGEDLNVTVEKIKQVLGTAPLSRINGGVSEQEQS